MREQTNCLRACEKVRATRSLVLASLQNGKWARESNLAMFPLPLPPQPSVSMRRCLRPLVCRLSFFFFFLFCVFDASGGLCFQVSVSAGPSGTLSSSGASAAYMYGLISKKLDRHCGKKRFRDGTKSISMNLLGNYEVRKRLWMNFIRFETRIY